MLVKYEFVTGQAVEIEVEDSVGEVIIEIEKEQYNKNRAETRRHNSFESMEEDNSIHEPKQFADPKADVELQVEISFRDNRLYDAIEQLAEQQKELIKKVYFQNKKMSDIAAEEGVSKMAITNRMKKIHTKLKKILE